MILIANNVSCNLIIIQSFNHHEDASLALWALLFHHLHFGIIVDIVVLSSLLSLLVYSLCYFHVIVVSSVISFCHYRHFSVFPFVIIIVIVIYHRHRFVTMVTVVLSLPSSPLSSSSFNHYFHFVTLVVTVILSSSLCCHYYCRLIIIVTCVIF